LVIDADGKMIAHIGGCPASYSKDLAAYLEFAAGKLDKAALDQRLMDHNVVASTQTDIAKRHLQLGQRLMARGDYEEARSELEKGLELQPSDVMLQLMMARVDLLTHHPQEALQAIEKIDPKQLPNWRINAVRGRAMVALGQWDKARDTLLAAVRLNPEPSEVHYALGLVYEHDKDFQKAAASYRLAFETGESGKQLGIPLH
jgi:tetratricopeptide (TPR) repeat protein